jgi:hypothetical protein
MAGTDPKKTSDPGHLSDREDYDADEDPLVELARIVSEDGGFSGRTTPRPRVEPAEPMVDRNAFSSDLEAELLQELETSFSGREPPPAEPEPYAAPEQPYAGPEPEEPVYPAPLASKELRSSEQSQPAPQADDPDDLLRSIEEQLSQFEQRVRSASDEAQWLGDGSADEPDIEPEPRDEWQDAPGMAAARPDYHFRGPAAADWDRADEREQEVAANEEPVPHEPEAAAEPVTELFGRSHDTPMEPSDHGYAEEEIVAEADTQLARDDDERPTPVDELAEVEVHHGARDFASLEEELSAELDSAYRAQESGAGRQAQEEPEDEREFAAAAAVVTPGPGRRPPAQPHAQPPAPPRRRSGRGFMMAAAVVIVAVIGGVGALYYRSLEQTSSGPPPVIAAPEGPVKIEPAEQADAGEETVGEAVFDRVAGNAPETEETVVDGAEEPREIARIVAPEQQEPQASGEEAMMEEPAAGETATGDEGAVAAATQDGAPAAAEAQGSAEDFGPRRVPTYVVRPDGTIVTTEEAEGAAGEPASSEQEMAMAQTEAMEPTPVETVAIEEPRTAGTPGEPTMAAGDSASDAASAAPAETETAMASAEGSSTGSVMGAQTDTASIEAAEQSAGAAAESLDQEAEATAAPAQVPPTVASGFLVQLSAQTSQAGAEATFADLQRRYPSILGDLEANIQRADLDKGTFYRVRVGPWAERSQAVEVCEALKTAGADCYVAR